MAPADDASFRPLLVDTCDRPADTCSRYVADASKLADIQSRIRHDLRQVGRLDAHAPAAIVAASIVVLNNPATWMEPSPPRDPLRSDELQLAARDAILSAWAAAQAEIADVGQLIARLRMEANEQIEIAAHYEQLGGERQRTGEALIGQGAAVDAQGWFLRAESLRARAAQCRAKAAEISAEADRVQASRADRAEAA